MPSLTVSAPRQPLSSSAGTEFWTLNTPIPSAVPSTPWWSASPLRQQCTQCQRPYKARCACARSVRATTPSRITWHLRQKCTQYSVVEYIAAAPQGYASCLRVVELVASLDGTMENTRRHPRAGRRQKWLLQCKSRLCSS